MTCAEQLGRRATSILLGYVFAFILVLTLSPFDFSLSASVRVIAFESVQETLANVVFFIPLGYLYALRPRRRGHYYRIALFGLLTSLGVEFVQLALPSRLTSLNDVAANTVGCLLGGYLCGVLARHFNRQRLGALVLELPSFSLLYLLVPLFWLVHLSDAHPSRTRALSITLCLTGAIVIGGLWRYRIGPHALVGTAGVAALSVGWFLLAAFFAVQSAPLWALGLAAMFGFLVWLIPNLPSQQLRRGHRFEPVVLAAALATLGAFQLTAVAWPLDQFVNSFAATVGWPNFSFNRSLSIRLAESIAALSTIGYTCAALLARLHDVPRISVYASVAFCTGAALLSELMLGFRSDNQASALRFVLCIGGAMAAIRLYWIQIELLRAIRRESAEIAQS